MVSVRGTKNRFFEKGERVLCYEPDPTKAKVLYDSKVLGTYESKDKRGRKLLQYKIHFQGWSSSWDRKVNADFVLKDTEANRQLQKDLADKAQLYLERNSSGKKYSRKQRGSAIIYASIVDRHPSSVGGIFTNFRNGASSEDNFSSGSTFERTKEEFAMRDDCETESCCSSAESNNHDGNRVQLRISERLRLYLEYDYERTVRRGKQLCLPSSVPVVAILENFVKQTTVKLVSSFSNSQAETTRRRSTLQRIDKMEREFEKLQATVSLMKEVADGLRIYFDFTVVDYLLYKEEKPYVQSLLTEERLKDFLYAAPAGWSPDLLSQKLNLDAVAFGGLSDRQVNALAVSGIGETPLEEPQKRKLRSHRSDDCDVLLDNNNFASTSGGSTHPYRGSPFLNWNYVKLLQTMSATIPPQIKEYLQKVLLWKILPTNAAPTPSMLFGAPHLARLIVKLPEFLNASTMNDEKLKLLLQHLDTFTNYLESHREWFTDDSYGRTRKSEEKMDAGAIVAEKLRLRGEASGGDKPRRNDVQN